MAHRKRSRGSGTSPLDDVTALARVRPPLQRLQALLAGLGHPRAGEVARLIETFDDDRQTGWRVLDGNAWWGGAGSLAAETILEPRHLPPGERTALVRELRDLMGEIAEVLRARGPTNPGLESWLLAFRNWNDSQV